MKVQIVTLCKLILLFNLAVIETVLFSFDYENDAESSI